MGLDFRETDDCEGSFTQVLNLCLRNRFLSRQFLDLAGFSATLKSRYYWSRGLRRSSRERTWGSPFWGESDAQPRI